MCCYCRYIPGIATRINRILIRTETVSVHVRRYDAWSETFIKWAPGSFTWRLSTVAYYNRQVTCRSIQSSPGSATTRRPTAKCKYSLWHYSTDTHHCHIFISWCFLPYSFLSSLLLFPSLLPLWSGPSNQEGEREGMRSPPLQSNFDHWIIVTSILSCTVSEICRIIGPIIAVDRGHIRLLCTRSGRIPGLKIAKFCLEKPETSLYRMVWKYFDDLDRLSADVWQTDKRTKRQKNRHYGNKRRA